MAKTLDMQLMRYMNLFEKISKTRPSHCFLYNSGIIFVLPAINVSKAIGENGKNVRKISEILNKKVKIIAFPQSIEDAEKFISAIVHPIEFKKIDISDREIIISAGKQSKAMLIGRNKSRFQELQEILRQYFQKELKII